MPKISDVLQPQKPGINNISERSKVIPVIKAI